MLHRGIVFTRGALALVALALSASAAVAQSYQVNTSQIPSGAGYTENVDFGDVDLDGDRDCALADGGDFGNEQNRLWINLGGAQGGTLGFFQDQTSTRFPLVAADGRDVDFVDIDHDGDHDLYISVTSASNNQSNRWWINMGGAQGGSAGFYQDQTSTRWTYIAVNNGGSHASSIAASAALGSGGFIDWSCDCVFGDLDSDGDMDLFHSTYGGIFGGNVPSRVFLNDGAGFYEEFNPSYAQLSGTQINNGTPALWCQGTHQHDTNSTNGAQADIADTPLGAELGDIDLDLDIDVLQGARNEIPRLYRNQLIESGAFVQFRDVTYISFAQFATSGGNYEQELGDFEQDDDLDIYGLNWPGISDCTSKNNGGVFGPFFTLPNSGSDDNEGDFLDYDNDGKLDIFVANFSGNDRLYRNDGPPNFTHSDVTAAQLPSGGFASSLGCDSCDIDHDGDYDIIVAEDSGGPEVLYKNVNQILDAIAPRAAHLEQAPNRTQSPVPTAIRVHVYSNSSWDVSRYDTVVLEYRVNGGAFSSVPMHDAGGQLCRGELSGSLLGTVDYRVRATDEHGNVGVSAIKTYVSGCTGASSVYCTAGTTTFGCTAQMSTSGTPNASASSGFTLTASGVEGQKQGILFYGVNGRQAVAWAPGSTSWLCVIAPTQRMGAQNSGGTALQCDGTLSTDWCAFVAAHPGALGAPFSVGQLVQAQAWFRDPAAVKTTSLSNAVEFSVCP